MLCKNNVLNGILKSDFQFGRVVTNFFIDALEPDRHCLLFMSLGALFQAFILSFVTLEKALEFY